jgi:hypothetical protein
LEGRLHERLVECGQQAGQRVLQRQARLRIDLGCC